MATRKRSTPVAAAAEILREHALAFPATSEHFPWGELAVKVQGKTFLFMRAEKDTLSFSVKLPQSREFAIDLPFAAPTGYGLGRSGWITATFEKTVGFPVDVIKDWVTESYRAVAPKRVLRELDGATAAKSR